MRESSQVAASPVTCERPISCWARYCWAKVLAIRAAFFGSFEVN